MKNFVLVLTILCSVLQSRADITFNWNRLVDDSKTYGYKYEYFYIYKDGVRLSSTLVYPYDKTSITVPLEPGNYSYSSTMGHVGDCSGTDRINLTINRLIVRFKTDSGTPVENEKVSIFRNGKEIGSATTNSNGEARFFLSPSDQYAYKTEFGEGALPALESEDVEVEIKSSLLNAVAKYGNYPIPDRFSLLSETGTTSFNYKYSSSSNGLIRFNVSPDKNYYLENELGAKCGPFRAGSQIHYLEYRKITFISEGENAPSLLKSLNVTGTSKSGSKSVVTDGIGQATVYLLPGKYRWHHLVGSGDFEVGDEDKTISLSSVKSGLRFVHNGVGVADVDYTISSADGAAVSGKTDNTGFAEFDMIQTKGTVTVNGLGDYYIDDFSAPLDIPLYRLTVSGESGIPSFTLRDSKNNNITFPCSTGIYLLPGAYKICRNGDLSNLTDIYVNNDIAYRLGIDKTLTIKVTDTSGATVPDYTLWCMRNGTIITSSVTNSSGLARFVLPENDYCIQDPTRSYISENVKLNADTEISCIVPAEIRFSVSLNGKPYDGQIIWQPTGAASTALTAVAGSVSARISSDRQGLLSIPGYTSADIPVTIGRNSELNLVSASITCNGKGITVPDFGEQSEALIAQGKAIRLKAIPTQYGTFRYWTINGVRYDEDVIDYTVGSSGIHAVATFDEKTSYSSPAMISGSDEWHIYPNPVETTVNFPEEINALVDIYSTDGRNIQKTRVVGSSMNVSDLTAGVYILMATPDNPDSPVRKARFIKK